MVDFKKLSGVATTSYMNPIDIYDNLDRQTIMGPLRPSQETILRDWYDNHLADRDVIVKLHTGEGKTLIGLLMLLSKQQTGEGPCLYVCPNKYLAKQVSEDAKKFGIKHILDEGGTELPLEFVDGKSILITYVQRVFNGFTKFGIDNQYQKVGAIVLDDSHACIDYIREASSIRIPRNSELFVKFLNIFETSLRSQGAGYFLDIQRQEYSSTIVPVPFWDWIEKQSEVAQLLYEYSDNEDIRFAYPLLKNIWEKCTAYVTSSHIAITPDFDLVDRFSSFTNCRQRILMSATTQDDSFFVKGLSFSKESIQHPLTYNYKKWSGEKMILFPSYINPVLNVDVMRQAVCDIAAKSNIATVALVPSRHIAYEYINRGAIFANDNMENVLSMLREGTGSSHVITIANRYDGIDLPDNQCRILILDSIPMFGNLSDQYERNCRRDSELISTKVAQKIEQGLGRSVRGEKDYSIILMLGEDLVRFVRMTEHHHLFSAQTRKQIEIAEILTRSASDENSTDNPYKALYDVMGQFLNRDEDWKQFYQDKMNTIDDKEQMHPLIDILEQEHMAEKNIAIGNYSTAENIYQKLADMVKSDNLENGWYLQKVAKCVYFRSKIDALQIQKRAHSQNDYLLMPENVQYTKLDKSSQSQMQRVITYFRKFKTFGDLYLKVNELLANLSFGISANTFESSLCELGNLLGFVSQRPDQTFKVGPDNLWMTPNDSVFFLFECKNEVLLTRDAINKDEVGQMNNHIGWFRENYSQARVSYFIHVHPKNILSNKANYVEDVNVLTPTKLELLKQNVKGFITEFSSFDLSSYTDDYIYKALQKHVLTYDAIVPTYTEKPIIES